MPRPRCDGMTTQSELFNILFNVSQLSWRFELKSEVALKVISVHVYSIGLPTMLSAVAYFAAMSLLKSTHVLLVQPRFESNDKIFY